MLPSSHTSFIDAPFAVKRVDELVELQVLAHMHNALREDEPVLQRTKASHSVFLADAFAEFIATSSRLETSYRALQREVSRLDGELAARNAELSASLRQNESIRFAKALAEVATILAHEVRNPLASLEFFAGLLESTPQDQQRWISNIRAGIRTLSATVNNVLTFHDVGSLKLSRISLVTVIAEAIQLMQPLADQAEIEMGWTNNTHDLIVAANQSALQQVMINLIHNAIRHTRSNGKITITLDHYGKQAIIHCSDNGCGVPADQIGHLFEPGFSGRGDSCGLGLAVCARIMQQHQGQISVSNLHPTGANFRLELPASACEEYRA